MSMVSEMEKELAERLRGLIGIFRRDSVVDVLVVNDVKAIQDAHAALEEYEKQYEEQE